MEDCFEKRGVKITFLGQFSLRGVERSKGVIINQPISLAFVIQEEVNYPEIAKRTVLPRAKGRGITILGQFSKGFSGKSVESG